MNIYYRDLPLKSLNDRVFEVAYDTVLALENNYHEVSEPMSINTNIAASHWKYLISRLQYLVPTLLLEILVLIGGIKTHNGVVIAAMFILATASAAVMLKEILNYRMVKRGVHMFVDYHHSGAYKWPDQVLIKYQDQWEFVAIWELADYFVIQFVMRRGISIFPKRHAAYISKQKLLPDEIEELQVLKVN